MAPLHSDPPPDEDDEEGLAVGGSLAAVSGSPIVKQAPSGIGNNLELVEGEQSLPTSSEANSIKAEGGLVNSEVNSAIVGVVESRKKQMSESSSSSSEEIDSSQDSPDRTPKNLGREVSPGNENGHEEAEGLKGAVEGAPSMLPAEGSKVAGGSGGGQSEMTWWADAMAECDNITDDLDEVVSKIEQGGGVGGEKVGSSGKGSAGRKSSRRGSKASESKGE